jgi:predicted DNA-binding transcriptional regulator AlpA
MKIETIRLKIDPALLEKAAKLAKREGVTPEAWLEETASRILTKKLTKDEDLAPRDAAKYLGVSKWTFGKLMRSGAFPGLYYVNARVARIPQADVENYKNRHQPYAAA